MVPGRVQRRLIVLATGSVAALSLAAAAVAAVADKEQIHLTTAGQAAARAAVLTRADLGTAPGWTGGAKKPDLSSTSPCPSFHPKQSDLVLNGAAETAFKQPGIQFDSEAQVLETAHMVKLDWQRTAIAPQILPCLRTAAAKNAGTASHVVSIRRISFPRLATYTTAIRILFDVKSPSATTPVRVFVDVVLVGRGRTELTLTTTAPLLANSVVRPAEVRLAKVLAGRIRA
jgi:hypothetical protein